MKIQTLSIASATHDQIPYAFDLAINTGVEMVSMGRFYSWHECQEAMNLLVSRKFRVSLTPLYKEECGHNCNGSLCPSCHHCEECQD